jgi:hypothetical protein
MSCNYEQLVEEKLKLSPTGNSCVFIKINRKLALKVYRCKKIRDATFQRQKECFAVGLAPEVGQCVDLGNGYYAYTTEVIKVICKLGKSFSRNQKKNHALMPKYRVRMAEVKDRLHEETDFYFTDSEWIFNWGTKDGQLMPLDFGY